MYRTKKASPLSLHLGLAFFNFPQDSVIHYASINSTFSVDGAFAQVTGALTYGRGETTISTILGAGLENFEDGVLWRDELLNPAAGTVSDSKSNQITLNDVFVHAGTIVAIYANGQNGNARINATIAFNPIAEWINFREPTIGARI